MSIVAPTVFTTSVLVADNVFSAGPPPADVTTTTAACGFELQSTSTALCVSRLTQAQINALQTAGTLTNGMILYNTTTSSFNMFANGSIGFSAQSETVTVTSAQLLALHGTPVTLIPAPGVGQVILLQQVSMEYVFNTTAYTVPGGANLRLLINGVTVGTDIAATGLLDQTANALAYARAANQTTAISPVNLVLDDQPLTLTNTNATEFTLGDGTLVVNVLYNIISV